jgi:uncharacterized membrane protein YtjA (UPF0391 family)
MNLLKWASIFLVLALVAAAFGFTGIASDAAGIARFVFAFCVGLFLGLLIVEKTLRSLSMDEEVAAVKATLDQASIEILFLYRTLVFRNPIKVDQRTEP